MMPWRSVVKLLLVLLGIALVCPALAAPGAALPPIIRTEISPRSAMVGQTITLRVDVLVPSWFTAPIDYPASISVAGVTAQLNNSAAVNLNEQINNQSYAGMSKLYTVVAQRAGEFMLPALPLKISYSLDGVTRAITLQTTPQTFRATLPPGAEDLGYFFATPSYSLKQMVDRSLNQLKVGDAIVRRITQRAEGVAAMSLPGLTFAEYDGVSVYPAEAQLNDSGGERGAARIGERVDSVTYVLRQAGAMELPGVKIGSFDTANGKMRWTSVPALRFEVAPDPEAIATVETATTELNGVGAPRSGHPAMQSTPASTGAVKVRTMLRRLWQDVATLPILGTLSTLLLVAFLLRRQGIRPLAIWRAWRERVNHSEPAQFKLCLDSLKDADATKALNASMRWLNHIKPNGRGASLTQFATQFGDEDFRQCIKQQQDRLFAQNQKGATWDALSFKRSLIAARQRWRRAQQSHLQKRHHLLPLNPVHDQVN